VQRDNPQQIQEDQNAPASNRDGRGEIAAAANGLRGAIDPESAEKCYRNKERGEDRSLKLAAVIIGPLAAQQVTEYLAQQFLHARHPHHTKQNKQQCDRGPAEPMPPRLPQPDGRHQRQKTGRRHSGIETRRNQAEGGWVRLDHASLFPRSIRIVSAHGQGNCDNEPSASAPSRHGRGPIMLRRENPEAKRWL
jgi:hypothetical protein